MTPKKADEFYRVRHTKQSDSDPRYRVHCEEGDPAAEAAIFEHDCIDLDFDLDARDDLGQRIQRHRIDEVKRFMDKLFETGVEEGKRQVRETLREVIGLDLGRR